MTSYNAANERMKRHYFAYLADAQGHSEQTIDSVAKAIARFEAYTRYKDFKTFHIEQAKAFKRDLADQRGHRSGEPLSKATLYATLTSLKHWSSTGPIRTIFREAFASVGLPYFNPHSFRKTLALLGGQRCKTPEEVQGLVAESWP
jgi:hypothetical protein